MSFNERRTALKGMLTGLLAPLMPACSSPPDRPTRITQGNFATAIDHLQTMIAQHMKAQALTGLSIALVDDQKLVWAQGFGWADQSAGSPASAETVYRTGSITKLFTICVALQLAERGQLDLDAPIRNVLPEFRIASRFGEAAITPRQIMTHHAGLPRDLAHGMWGNPDTGFKAVLDYLGESELSYPPGQVWSYSNLGLSVLGAAIERVTKVPFSEHVAQALLKPLGMETSSIASLPPVSPYRSKAYVAGIEAEEPALRDIAAGGLNASVRDMGRFLSMLFGQGRANGLPVLGEATVADMLRVQNDNVSLDLDLKMGLGWTLSPLEAKPLHGGGTMASHGGATVYHRSLIVALPRHRLGVVILCNSANARTLEQIARSALALALEVKTGIIQPEEAPPPNWRAASLPAAALAARAGEYVTPAGLIRVSVDGERLKARAQGFRFDLIPDEEGRLHVRKKILGLIPLPLGDLERMSFQQRTIAGREVLIAVRDNLRMLFGERIDTRMHPAWRDMLGVYVPVVEGREFSLIERLLLFEADGALNLRMTLIKTLADEPSGALLVQTLNDNTGIVTDRLANCGEAIRIHSRGDEISLELSGYKFRKTIT